MGIRRKGREIALQTLYSLEYLRKETDNSQFSDYQKKLDEIALEENIASDNKIYVFALQILQSLQMNITEIDEKIKLHSITWPFEKIANLDRNIMRIAVSEMLFSSVAHPVIMDEAIEISKKYCSESSGKFINGILNAVSQELRNDKKG